MGARKTTIEGKREGYGKMYLKWIGKGLHIAAAAEVALRTYTFRGKGKVKYFAGGPKRKGIINKTAKMKMILFSLSYQIRLCSSSSF